MGLELAFAGKLLKRLALKDAVVAGEILADAPVENTVTAIHKTRFLIGLLGERGDSTFGDGEFAKATSRLHGCGGGHRAVTFMKLHRSIDVAIAQAIAVGEKEILLAHMRQGAGEAAAGLEKKQLEKYGDSPEYQKWVARTWAGPMVGAPKVMPPRRVTDTFERVAWSGSAFPKK